MNKMAIVCVDDEPSILYCLEVDIEIAVGNDYLIETAENGEECLEVCEELLKNGDEIALVISDCIMPGMKGDELLKRIHILSPKTLTIMLTGQASIEAISNAIKYANLYRYIDKPWQSNDFRLTIKEALHSYLQNQKLSEFYADLERKIAQRTQELEEKNQALIKLNQEKNEFLGIAAHDLKNPLSAIQGFAEIIIDDYDEMPKNEVIEISRKILISARQMSELIKHLLNVNAIESGQKNISLRTVDILPLLQAMVDCYLERAKAKNIHLHCEYLEKPYDVFVDKTTVCEILDNLISNAIKYSPYDKNVYIRLLQNDSVVRCEIQDEGPGLSEDEQKQLFIKFKRLTPCPTGKEGSTGLGLFIVKKLVEALNGKVSCQSQLGQGTTFTVAFPKK
ncbi:sensory transduction histidine kinase [Beggiatoa sp. PS]|nr:sensory transduction histidine kinase [Beggiatoa sp. PS]